MSDLTKLSRFSFVLLLFFSFVAKVELLNRLINNKRIRRKSSARTVVDSELIQDSESIFQHDNDQKQLHHRTTQEEEDLCLT